MKFKDLQEGDKFIAQPSEEDNLTSNKPFYIFMKIIDLETITTGTWINAVRIKDGILSNMPDDMLIVHIE